MPNYTLYNRFGALHDLAEQEVGTISYRDEKKALRRAKEAEHRFRVSKGYEKETLWDRLKLRLFSNGGSL